jgi:diguanylate cyclase (GGDEF)-like protein
LPRPVSLRASLLGLVALCVLPTALIAGTLAVLQYQQQRERIHLDTVLLARRYAAELDRELAAIESGLRVLASAPELDDGDLASFDTRARAALRGQPGSNYALSDREGRQRLNTLRAREAPLPNVGRPDQLARVFDTGSATVTDLFIGPVSRTPVVVIGVPVFQGNEVVYSLNLGLPPTRIAAVLTRHELPEGWVASVLDGSGNIVARSRDPQRYVGQKAVPDVVQQIASAREGSIETRTVEGVPVVSSFSRSSVSDWSVAVGAPKAVIEAELAQLAGWVGAGVTLTLLSGIWLARRLAVRVSGAVRELNEAALALVEGRPVTLPSSRLVEAEAVGAALQQAAEILAQTRHLAHHDVLTGLCNRALFEENLRRQLAAAERAQQPVAVLAIDLDGFKAVNDQHGHAAGDQVLKEVASRITSTVRAYDVAARTGGDEFLVLLADIEPAAAHQLAERLVQALAQPYGEGLPSVSASVGVATSGASGADVGSLLERADQALYAAKRAGRRRAITSA